MNPYIRTPEIRALLRKELPKDVLEYDYSIRQLSFRQIAKEHGWSTSNVRMKIREYHIPLRTQQEGLHTPSITRMLHDRKSFLGKSHSEETRNKIRTKLADIKNDKDRYTNYIERQREGKRKFYAEHPLLASIRQINTYSKYDINKKISISQKRSNWWTPERRSDRSNVISKFYKTHPERKELSRLQLLENRKLMNLRPNIPENNLLNILNQHFPNEWKYVGDGSFVIEGLNPDFVNINGQKKVIEMFGDYWHSDKVVRSWKSTEIGRIMAFNSYRYKTLVIWEHELKDIEKVTKKLTIFCRHKGGI